MATNFSILVPNLANFVRNFYACIISRNSTFTIVFGNRLQLSLKFSNTTNKFTIFISILFYSKLWLTVCYFHINQHFFYLYCSQFTMCKVVAKIMHLFVVLNFFCQHLLLLDFFLLRCISHCWCWMFYDLRYYLCKGNFASFHIFSISFFLPIFYLILLTNYILLLKGKHNGSGNEWPIIIYLGPYYQTMFYYQNYHNN